MTEQDTIRRGSRLPKLLIGLAAVASGAAMVAGPGALGAAADTVVNGVTVPSAVNAALLAPLPSTTLTPTQSSNVPANCKDILAHAQTGDATKSFAGSSQNGSTTTYFFQVTSSAAASAQNIEDCAYANGDPSNIKYEAQADNPPFTGGTVFTSLTVDTRDSICDRVQITNQDGSKDFTNLVGSSNGKEDPSACQQNPNVPEAPAAGLIALAGLGVAGAAVVVWRRRNPTLAS